MDSNNNHLDPGKILTELLKSSDFKIGINNDAEKFK